MHQISDALSKFSSVTFALGAVLCCADVAFGLCTYAGGYSGVPVDDQTQCVSAAGFDHKLCMAWRQDNAGPHSAEEVCFAVSLLLWFVYVQAER